MPDPESRSLRLSTGLDYHLLEWGRDDTALDHTVVLVHGFLDLCWGWQDTVEAGLAGRFHVVAPDMRGHGDSDRVGAGGYYHFMDYVADLASVVAEVGRARVSLVGHSMGGSVVAYYAGAFPDRVSRLALLEGSGPPEDPTPFPDLVHGWVEGWKRARSREPRSYDSIESAAARLRQHDARLGQELSLRLARHGTRVCSDGRYCFKHDPLHVTRGPYPFRLDVARSFWQRIACPVLLVEGSESPFRERVLAEPSRSADFPDAERAVIDGAAHMIQRHRPAALGRLLAEFLSAHDERQESS